MTQPDLSPEQQNLLDFLDRLATADTVTDELLAEGYQALDAAVDELKQQQAELSKTTKNQRQSFLVPDADLLS
ncbi:MAG: hypothetical protein LDL41_22275 [Coleofasciculus sp. S288]|nr:hypothetical protein [Coleofasciculus sp. S288]